MAAACSEAPSESDLARTGHLGRHACDPAGALHQPAADALHRPGDRPRNEEGGHRHERDDAHDHRRRR